jgi:hypothetical protein
MFSIFMNLPSKPRSAASIAMLLLLSFALQGTALHAQSPYDERSTGEKVGGFFRRLFYGEPAPNPYYGPGPSSGGGRYSLDQPPVEMRHPRYRSSQRSDSIPPPPTPPSNRKRDEEASSTRNYSKTDPSTKRQKTPVKESKIEDEPPAKITKKNTPETEPIRETSRKEPTPEVTIKSNSQTETVKPDSGYTDSGKQSERKPTTTETKRETIASNSDAAPRNTPTSSPSPAPTKQSDSKETLTGSKTSKPGRVKSPYSPFNELDVQGLNSGQLALDPTTQRVFRVP